MVPCAVGRSPPAFETIRERGANAYVPGLRLRTALAAQPAADAAAEGHRGSAQGLGRRGLPQRPASRRRLFRPRRGQPHEPAGSRHEAAGDARARERRRSGGLRPRRHWREARDPYARRSVDRLRQLRGLPAQRGQPLHGHAQPRCVQQRRVCRLPDGAAPALSVRHRRSAAGTRRAARLLGRHHLRRLEEGDDAQARADGDHRRRRARADVSRSAQGDGRSQCHRRRYRSGQARCRQAGGRRGGGRRQGGRCGRADQDAHQGWRLGGDRPGRIVAIGAARL